ncbi:zinc ABC transporter ATP-binding protein AztA [Microbacterium sp. 18062]|uniref:zinc ABC transporter ATP-binding protein AztA n=1 Tax=Microbacterium sp. 18062 TaxID=2681410 RepID=UPI0013579895|nr:zinc ABC transporter ATP-binding protein AztA [Microbacterium sp. 18062]
MIDVSARTDAAALDDVSVRIDGATVLHPLDLAIQRGGLTVITGPNGAGKTTLLETVAGVRKPATGVVRRLGFVAFVPQRAAIPSALPLTVREVVEMGVWGSVGGWRLLGRAGRVAVATAAEALGIERLMRRPFAELSGGQRQRALLAQALARRADLLLLDEPTTGLDDDSARRIQDAMDAETARGAAVLCVSHDRGLCARASRVIRLADGRLTRPSAR